MSKNKNSGSSNNSKKGRDKIGIKKLPVESIIGTGNNKSSLPTRPSSSMAGNDSSDSSKDLFIEVNNKKHHNSNSSNNKKCLESISNHGTMIHSNGGGGFGIDPNEKPFEFLSMKYQHVTLSSKNTIATRSKCSNNVIFFNRPIKLGERIVLKVLKKDPDPPSSFLLGMTTCGLQKIQNIPGHLVEFCKPFFKCGGYSIHNHVNYANAVGDIIEIERLKSDGSLRVRTNGRQSGIRDMTDGARFKTAKAVPFLNLNLGVSSIQILHDDSAGRIKTILDNSPTIGRAANMTSGIKSPLSYEQSIRPSKSPSELSQSSYGGDANIVSVPVKSTLPPPGFGLKKTTSNKGVPFSESTFGLDLRTPSPIISLPGHQSGKVAWSEKTYSQLFHQPDKDDLKKAVRRPSTERKAAVTNCGTSYADMNGSSSLPSESKRTTITTHWADLCDINLVNIDGSYDEQCEPMSRRVIKLGLNPSLIMVEKWITNVLVNKKDIYTIDRDDKNIDKNTNGRFYAFLKQPLEPNTRCTFKIKRLVDLNLVKNTLGTIQLDNSITFGLTNVDITNTREELEVLPMNPLNLINRSYEEWFISTNIISSKSVTVGMVFHIERNRDGEVFCYTENSPMQSNKDWFQEDSDCIKDRKATFNVFYCSQYYLFLSLNGIVSSIELVAISKLSEEYNNNNFSAIVSLNGALNCVNLASAKCIRCKGAEVEWAINDCSHRSYCESCAKLLERKQSNCLVCGTMVSSVSRIFI